MEKAKEQKHPRDMSEKELTAHKKNNLKEMEAFAKLKAESQSQEDSETKAADKAAEKEANKGKVGARSKATTIDNIKNLAVIVKGNKATITGKTTDGKKIRIEKVYKDRYGPSVSIK